VNHPTKVNKNMQFKKMNNGQVTPEERVENPRPTVDDIKQQL